MVQQESLLEVIGKVDKFPYVPDSNYYSLIAHDEITQIGYITKSIAHHFAEELALKVDHEARTVTIDPGLDTLEKRESVFADMANRFRKIPEFDIAVNKGWRNELYTIYNPSQVPYLKVERAFSILMGVITYGIHLNGYVPAEKSNNGKLKLWVQRRSATKQTYPGMLDNTVAGGLGYPHGLWETVVKECYEEGGLPPAFVEPRAKPTGVLLYIYQQQGEGSIAQPEVEYIYDLPFDDETSVVPKPVDGEAESFVLMDVQEILLKIMQGEFKPNCSLVVVDFLIRNGHITPESEPNYAEIVSRTHRRMPFPTR
ncbi:hypothetical protein HYPBUDRAFT_153404 [Hyphopichia burtonii NRRL Y-1933]|uniref:Nudix hydrolase domain-containing protein n=1 Tax=Hyphopichia burtonii NRRL Y-1933 TaxID=984485 RepID=A0A1E4RHD3_9ASCO|nr:hypothetical protein HYPBUDRAFT_153404 [Hyphopichia burtonii NRRL Y-1933]ODV66668.1 hypothetical protein HYPBUDRAFT_153404 [Hyphopichia burtonii NRRL Y-1933]